MMSNVSNVIVGQIADGGLITCGVCIREIVRRYRPAWLEHDRVGDTVENAGDLTVVGGPQRYQIGKWRVAVTAKCHPVLLRIGLHDQLVAVLADDETAVVVAR